MAEENNKVTVMIYGQEYTFASVKSKERILRAANHVDEVMNELAEGIDGIPNSALAMLSAINITEELFVERDAQSENLREKERLEKDMAHFQQLWEEAKRTHLQHKEDIRVIQDQKDDIQEKYNSRAIEFESLMRSAKEKDSKIERLEAEVNNANTNLRSYNETQEDNSELVRELQDKLKEIEGNYFELQMENIQMKGDLERYRNRGK